jgi:hypothetical protein
VASAAATGTPRPGPRTDAERRRVRGRVASLAHQVAGMLASGGWTVEELREAPTAADAPDPAAQEKARP